MYDVAYFVGIALGIILYLIFCRIWPPEGLGIMEELDEERIIEGEIDAPRFLVKMSIRALWCWRNRFRCRTLQSNIQNDISGHLSFSRSSRMCGFPKDFQGGI